MLEDCTEVARPIHPALEVVDDTLYVTVHTTVQGERGYTVLSSDGEVFSPAEWAAACRERQFAPLADVRLARCAPRWHGAGIRDALLALRSGADRTPTWPGCTPPSTPRWTRACRSAMNATWRWVPFMR